MSKIHKQFIKSFAILIAIFFISKPPLVCAIDFTKETLPNGLILIHIERHTLPAVMGNLLIDTSPFDEPPQKAGLANLTASLLTEGTTKMTSQEIAETLDFIGANISATVSRDYTNVYFRALKKDIVKTFEVFTDIVFNPSFEQKEFDKKKQLIKSMLKRQEEQPSFIAQRELLKSIFSSHPYGRIITGSIETIDNISLQDIKDFYRKNYTPKGAILVIAGDISKQEFQNLVKPFRQWKAQKTHTTFDFYFPTPSSICKKIITDKKVTQANISFGHIGIARSNPDFYAVAVMNYILGGGGFASRLMQTVRDDMGLAYSIYSYFAANKEPGYFEVSVQTSNEKAHLAINEILKQMQRIKTEPVSDQEIQDAKSYLTGSFPRRLETTQKILDMITAQEFYKLGDDYIKRYPEYINAVTKDDVLNAAKKYLHHDKCIISIVGDKKKLNINE